MSVDIIMPKMGESIMEGTILKWHKKPGDKINVDETILEISTDKVDTEVPSPESGIVSELLYKEGDVVEVGKVIAKLESNGAVKADSAVSGEAVSEPVKEDAPKPEAEVTFVKEEIRPEPLLSGSNVDGKFYSPLVLNIAQKEGIGFAELEKISGTGAGGRVSKKDILAYLQIRTSKPAEAEKIQEIKPVRTEVKTAVQEKKIDQPCKLFL